MAGVEFGSRQSASLPSITSLNIEKGDANFDRKQPTTMMSPSYASTYSFPHPSASSLPPASSTISSLPASLSGLISPPESRRTSGDEKESRQQLPRQSLPSIHEALGQEQSYSQAVPPPSTSQQIYQQPPPTTPQSQQPSQQHSSPSETTRRTYPSEFQSQTPNTSFTAPNATRSPYLNPPATISAPPPIQSAPLDPLRRPSYSSTHNPKLPALHPLRTEHSPVTASLPQLPYSAYPAQSSPAYETGPQPQSAGPVSTPYGYSQQPTQANYPYSAPPQGTAGSNYPPTATFSAPPRYAGSWRPDATELSRVEETKRNGRLVGPAYGESVKRHLDNFDLEASLNEIADASGRTLDFARHYGHRAHQTQRSGPVPGSMPSLLEVDEQLKQQQRLHDALVQLREVVQSQQVVEQSKDPRYKAANGYESEEMNGFNHDQAKAGGFAGSDPKKRRGRAAPPGRCHSCNRAETPEWRRGPDGARTLCNACGLHYAKLTRKMGTNKAAIGSSNLRPKSMGPSSPTA